MAGQGTLGLELVDQVHNGHGGRNIAASSLFTFSKAHLPPLKKVGIILYDILMDFPNYFTLIRVCKMGVIKEGNECVN